MSYQKFLYSLERGQLVQIFIVVFHDFSFLIAQVKKLHFFQGLTSWFAQQVGKSRVPYFFSFSYLSSLLFLLPAISIWHRWEIMYLKLLCSLYSR